MEQDDNNQEDETNQPNEEPSSALVAIEKEDKEPEVHSLLDQLVLINLLSRLLNSSTPLELPLEWKMLLTNQDLLKPLR